MHRASSPSVRIISVGLDAPEKALEEYVQAIRRRPEVLQVVLFGSLATGRYAPGSDVDLLLVLAASPKPFHERIPDYLPERFPVGVDVFPYTAEEIDRNPFPQQALREGRVLWQAG